MTNRAGIVRPSAAGRVGISEGSMLGCPEGGVGIGIVLVLCLGKFILGYQRTRRFHDQRLMSEKFFLGKFLQFSVLGRFHEQD
jgi:hypothetical protein